MNVAKYISYSLNYNKPTNDKMDVWLILTLFASPI